MPQSLEELNTRGELVWQYIIDYTPNVIGALVTLVVGRRVIQRLYKIIRLQLRKGNVDPTVRRFLLSLIDILLKVVLIIAVAGMFGVKTTSFVALLGAAGLAVGLSLQGSLSNFSGGVIILLFKPYEVDDLVDISDEKGRVTDITVFNTRLVTLENNDVILPNGPIINNKIVNYSKRDTMRIDVPVGISYDADIDATRKVLLDVANNEETVLDEPAPEVITKELGGSSVNLAIRVFCHPDDHRKAYFALTEQAKKALDTAGIEIPFPQRVVHMHNE